MNAPRWPLWCIRFFQYEYWSTKALYYPIVPILLFYALKARALGFFTAVNPSFENGGMINYSKFAVLKLIPDAVKAKTQFVSFQAAWPVVHNFGYPVIAKPDKGERGKGVQLIKDASALKIYHSHTSQDYLLQPYIDLPLEYGVLYSRLPSEKIGIVSSLTSKSFLQVVGDGKSTLEMLIQARTRSRLVADTLALRWVARWNEIIPKAEIVLLEPIGNHNRGTKFISEQDQISAPLTATFDKIAKQIPGFQFGRFDLRCSHPNDLLTGENIFILELNGVNSEPTHIYDSRTGLWGTFSTLLWHWRRIRDISIENQKMGIVPQTVKDFLVQLKM